MTRFYRTPRQIEAAYASGLPGWQFDQDTMEDLFCDKKVFLFSIKASHLKGVGKGKKAFLWRSRELFDPGAFGHEQQTTGDCVSHGCRNCFDTVRCVEIHIKGEPEEFFLRTATEPCYGSRGHGGQGMDPAKATRFTDEFGTMFRMKYLYIDLTKYNSKIGTNWGRSGVPTEVKEECKKHDIGKWISPSSIDEVKDLLYAGYALHSGQKFGVKNKSDKYGIAIQGIGWNHDVATVGYDDTREVYPDCVYLVANSWGVWNAPPAVWPVDRYGEWPIGSFWVREELYAKYFVGSRSIFAYCDVKGVPQKNLPNFGDLENVLG